MPEWASAPDLLALPFDQYARHRDAREVAQAVRACEGPARLAVLDVGGYPCLLPRFLPDDWVVVVDPAPGTGRGYLRASGLALPFRDASFDLVCSLDTLEHVPPAGRPRYLAELLRVSRRYVLVLAPFASAETERAEALLFEYIKTVLHAEHAQLREHRQYGLPELATTVDLLRAGGAACETFPCGYLYHWLPLMLLKHYLLSLDPEAAVHAALDRWYNASGVAADRRLPAYRFGILASKQGRTAVLAAVAERFAPAAPAPVAELLARQDLQLVLGLLALERGNRGPAPLLERLAAQERQIAALTREVETLRAHLAAIRRGRVMRLLNAINHLLGRDSL
ncbi:MAG TPA: class I SAM-dependent methyltransferase [Chloroflexota bacterium]|nr:class I SAM-dependent methyltransferase [Chloroflexota bacterium]